MAEAEIMARRRKWSTEQKAALLSEVEAKGGRIAIVARRHGLSESLLYNWQSAWQAGSSARAPEAMQFMPLGVIDGPGGRPALLAAPEHLSDAREPPAAHVDHIEIELPNGVRVRVAGSVNGSPDQPHQRTVALAAITTVISTLQRRPAIRNVERLPSLAVLAPHAANQRGTNG